MTVKNIIFDLDGTLADTLRDLGSCTNTALSEFNFPTHEIEAYKLFVGNGMRVLIERALPEDHRDDQTIDTVRERFTQLYETHYLDKTCPYDGMPEAVKSFYDAKIKLAVVTNKPENRAVEIVETLFGNYFEIIAGQTADFPLKPDPTLTLDVMRRMGAKKEDTIFIGDSGVDISTAKNAGLYAVGVLWGFRGEDELNKNGANILAKTPDELIKIVKSTL